MKFRKGEIGIGVIFLVVILAFFAGWLVEFNQRECRSNRDCGQASYCGSDFSCHEYPVVQQTIVQYNFLLPALIIGIAIVAAALIYRQRNRENEEVVVLEEKPAVKEAEEAEEMSKPYYNSNGNIKTP